MTKVFKDYYLAESAKEYTYKIKLAVNDFTSEQKDALERALAKFDLRKVGSYSDTPIQKHPLDFPNVRNTKVYIVELVLGYPVTVDELRVYLCDKIGVNQQSIAVYNAYDPRDVYTDEALSQADAMKNGTPKDYVPVVGTEFPVEDKKPLYGKSQTEETLKVADEKRKELRKVTEIENPLMPKAKFDTKEVKDVGEHGGDSVLGGKNGPGKHIKRGKVA